MTAALENQPTPRQDPAYQQAMGALQRGEWQRAIDAFEALQRLYPHHTLISRGLDEARFKAGLDSQTQVRAKRWIFNRRGGLGRMLMLLLLLFLGYQGFRLVQARVLPAMAEARQRAQQAQWLTEGLAFLDAGAYEEATARFQQLLAVVPGHAEALAGLKQIGAEKELMGLYEQGLSLQASGDYVDALAVYTDLTMSAPDFRDVGLRILQVKRRMEIEGLLAKADQLLAAGAHQEAAEYYRQLQAVDANFERDYVAAKIFTIYFDLGQEALDQPVVQVEGVKNALGFFKEALSQQPNNDAAIQEQRLARAYLAGRELYDNREWHQTVSALSEIYELNPRYLGTTLVQQLYDAYIGSGDIYREEGDLYLAYDQYSRAAGLPVSDTVVARGRIAEIQPFLTPTPTPTITPTPSNTPTITPIPPTAAPTPTPTPRPLSMFRGRIVFQSSNEDQPGFWVMDPDGGNREYLGEDDSYTKGYEEIIKQHQFSPDGRYRAYVTSKSWDKDSQVYVKRPPHPDYGKLPDRAISQLTGLSYDPVWSPDGGRIAFVSQENESDDIWIANADGSDRHSLMRNPWEWDKHPSWSPDSQRLAFWSNRTGTKQIFIMDANGQNVRNISNVPWDEENPVWIK